MKTLVLIRHGELPPAYRHRYTGTIDAPLGPEGVAQCRALKERAAPYRDRVVYCSPLRRATESARIIFGGEKTLVMEPRLHEIDFGDWNGKSNDEINAGPTAALQRVWLETPEKMVFPNGEAYRDVMARVDSLLAELPDGETSVLVTHGGIIMYLICKLYGYPLVEQWKRLPKRGTLCVVKTREFTG